jgi:glycosidase
VKGKAGSPYAIKDYYNVDPDLADCVDKRLEEFEALTQRTHQAGMKVIIDFVPNHVARQYDSKSKPEGVENLGETDDVRMGFSTKNNFYYIPEQAFAPSFSLDNGGAIYHEFPAKATGNDCFHAYPSCNDWYETVKLNYGIDYAGDGQTHFDPIPNTWAKMRDILLFWASKDIDGFRCDMAEMVPVEFWAWTIPQIKAKYPKVIFIAEVYNPQQYRNYLYTGKFDYLYDKVGLYDTLRLVVNGHQPAHALTHCWQSVDDIQDSMLNFLENHDEQRIASDFFAGDSRKAFPALVVSATLNRNPFLLYFGQELGEKGMDQEGFSGLDGRTSIFDYWSISSICHWRDEGRFTGKNLSKEQKKLRNDYVKILRLCNTNKAIRQGLFYDLMYVNLNRPDFDSGKQYAFLRYCDGELLLIVVNFDFREVDVNVFLPAHAFELFKIDENQTGSGKDLLFNQTNPFIIKKDSYCPVKIKAYNAAIIKFSFKK